LSFDTTVVIQRVHPAALMPAKAHPSDACYDLAIPEAVRIGSHATTVVDLGIALELEEGWEAQVRGRSGLSTRGIVVHPGTIDHLYRQPLKCIIHNIGDQPQAFEAGQRIAQLKIERVWNVQLVEGAVAPTARGGLGSTGV
jgi:dUTP pyrophosphatase